MFPYALWRWNGLEWKFVKGVSNKNISHCSKFETVLVVGCNPNKKGIVPEY